MRGSTVRPSVPTILTIVLCCAWSGSLPVAAQRDAVEVETLPLRGGIFMLTGAGGNLGVSTGDDGVFLVDDQYAPLTDKIKAAVAKLGDRPIRFVLNTHWHADHTGGNENLGRSGSLIVAHDNVRVRLTSDQFVEFFDNHVKAYPAVALPVVTFNDSVTFHLNGEEIHAFHVGPSAHTDGDSVVQFRKADVVHLGDILFNGMYPFIDVPNGGSVDGVIAAAERVLGMIGEETQLIPGHGPLADKAALTAYRDMLVAVRGKVAALVAEGKSLEEVRAARPTADFDEKWGGGFIQADGFVGLVYDSLTR